MGKQAEMYGCGVGDLLIRNNENEKDINYSLFIGGVILRAVV